MLKKLERMKLILTEIDVSYRYTKKFMDFKKKYYPFIYKYPDTYFGSFHNSEKIKNLSKGFARPEITTHSDPTGLYCYPINLLINHLKDVKYASDRNYLIIVKRETENYVIFQDLTEEELIKYGKKLYNDFEERYKYQLFLENMSRIKPGKSLFFIIQRHIYNKEEHIERIKNYTEKYNQKEIKEFIDRNLKEYGFLGYKFIENGLEQNARARKMKIYCLIDKAKEPAEAVINPNEPSQAVFLRRDAYSITDVYKVLPDEVNTTSDNLANKIKGIIAKNFKLKGLKQSVRSGSYGSLIYNYYDERYNNGIIIEIDKDGDVIEVILQKDGLRASIEPQKDDSLNDIRDKIIEKYYGMLRRIEFLKIQDIMEFSKKAKVFKKFGIKPPNLKDMTEEDAKLLKKNFFDDLSSIHSYVSHYLSNWIDSDSTEPPLSSFYFTTFEDIPEKIERYIDQLIMFYNDLLPFIKKRLPVNILYSIISKMDEPDKIFSIIMKYFKKKKR